MKFSWHFSKVNPRFKNREATQGEFFASDTELRGFVREAVQNSLDARIPDSANPVAVRIYLSGEDQALEPSRSRRYFKGGWEHFHADGCGLRDAADRNEPCRFVVYEDSGTTGLTGPVDQFHEVPGQRNPFYYFFRAEGQSNKLETGRGRWGLGKFVFPRSSRIRSFFGLTIRHDDGRRLLVGQSILRSHRVEDKSYTPDGWFGEKPGRKEAPSPIESSEFIDRFCRDFALERTSEPGLSVVIPFCDASWDARGVVNSVVQDYFSAILNEELIVTVESADTQIVINAHSIIDVLQDCDDDIRTQMQPLLELAQWACNQRQNGSMQRLDRNLSSRPHSRGNLRWSAKDVDEQQFRRVRTTFAADGRLAVRIPLTVQQRGQEPKATHFDVFLQKSESTAQRRPVFVREGIVISNVRSRLIRDISALVMVDDAPLAAFLGDAENPAHTEWQEEISHFKGKYVQGASVLRFVRNTVPDLCQLLTEPTDEQDSELLLDVFSIGAVPNGRRSSFPVGFETHTSRRRKFASPLNEPTVARRTRRPFRIVRRKGGFRIAGLTARAAREDASNETADPMPFAAPLVIEVCVAYDRRSGSALRNFDPTDFQLDHSPIVIQSTNASWVITSANVLRVTANGPFFEVVVAGFDVNRDLYLKAQVLKD
ncbi:MAG: hypothetical protein KDA91_02820 [Planctomycetaceae bacterium]|nr:hypothetical protein [Planctomycetaceae bacterium]